MTSIAPAINLNLRARHFGSSKWSLRPIILLRWLIILFPIWWLLGVEQFIWPLGLVFILLFGVIARNYRLIIPPFAKWLFLFILIYLLSGMAIEEASRVLTFTRTLGAYVSLLLLILIGANFINSWQDILSILSAFAVMMGMVGVIGTLALLDIWRPVFTSAIGYILPNWITQTSYGGQIAFRSLGRPSWFSVFGAYYRLNGLFLFATMYASALAVSLPIIIYLQAITHQFWRKALLTTLAVFLIINFVFTTGRIAIIGFLVGGLFFVFFHARWRPLFRLVAVFVVILISGVLLYDLLSMKPDVLPLRQWVDNFLFARGAGSFNDRFAVYQYTLTDLAHRPLLGWATERDIPNFPYPAGSHSYYLGVLYKQGFIGFSVFVVLIVHLIKYAGVPCCSSDHLQRVEMVKFIHYAQWSLIAIGVNGITDAVDLDATTFFLLGLIIILLIQTRVQFCQRITDS